MPSFLSASLPHHPAESFSKGMQSGQLLQADPAAAGEGTGELQSHHKPETKGRFWRSRHRRCGKCACVCLLIKPSGIFKAIKH